MTKRHLVCGLALAAFLFVGEPSPAYAYLDAGTGSLIVQGIIGLIAGITVSVGIYWNRIKLFFSSKRGDTPREIDATDEE